MRIISKAVDAVRWCATLSVTWGRLNYNSDITMAAANSTAFSGIKECLQKVEDRVQRSAQQRRLSGVAPAVPLPRLVAVSKSKPVSMIMEAYRCGHRHFGENYVDELLEKTSDPEIVEQAPDINWHFIGHLQRNKCKLVVSCRNLWVVETVHSARLAIALNSAWKTRGHDRRLRVMVQVNTSREENKHGVLPEECAGVVDVVLKECPELLFTGLMTIGSVQNSRAANGSTNPDFEKLVECRQSVCRLHNLPEEEVELSMGMSADFERAVLTGSTNVRVGSAIFGERSYPQS